MTWITWCIAIFGYLIIAIFTFSILDKNDPIKEDALLALFLASFHSFRSDSFMVTNLRKNS